MTEQELGKLKGFLGLCHRAGQVILGQDACVDAIRRETAALALMDQDSSEPSKKRLRNACYSHRVPLYDLPEGLIGGALGKSGTKVAAIKRGTMAEKLTELLPDEADTERQQADDTKHADIAGVQA